MGASQSARTVTITNDDLSFITLSESLVKRMVNEGEDTSGSARADNPTPVAPAHPKTSTEEPKPIQVISGPAYGGISTTQLRREVEDARNLSDRYWQHRLNNITTNDEKARAIEEKSYKLGLADVQKALKGYNTARYENPCVDKVGVLTQCYKSNSRQPLNCHKEVQAFSACVEDKHRNMMQARGSCKALLKIAIGIFSQPFGIPVTPPDRKFDHECALLAQKCRMCRKFGATLLEEFSSCLSGVLRQLVLLVCCVLPCSMKFYEEKTPNIYGT